MAEPTVRIGSSGDGRPRVFNGTRAEFEVTPPDPAACCCAADLSSVKCTHSEQETASISSTIGIECRSLQLESKVRYLGIEVDDALELSEGTTMSVLRAIASTERSLLSVFKTPARRADARELCECSREMTLVGKPALHGYRAE